MSDDVRDDYGTPITIGAATLDGGTIISLGDVDLNSTGTNTERPITVRYGGGADWRHTARYSAILDAYICDEVKMA